MRWGPASFLHKTRHAEHWAVISQPPTFLTLGGQMPIEHGSWQKLCLRDSRTILLLPCSTRQRENEWLSSHQVHPQPILWDMPCMTVQDTTYEQVLGLFRKAAQGTFSSKKTQTVYRDLNCGSGNKRQMFSCFLPWCGVGSELPRWD